MLTLINQQRQKGCNCGNTYYKAVPPLKWNTTLEKVAKAHSDDMRRRNTMTHYGKDAKDPAIASQKQATSGVLGLKM